MKETIHRSRNRPDQRGSEEEFIKAMNIPNSLVNRDVVLRGRKTMLRLMGLEEVEG